MQTVGPYTIFTQPLTPYHAGALLCRSEIFCGTVVGQEALSLFKSCSISQSLTDLYDLQGTHWYQWQPRGDTNINDLMQLKRGYNLYASSEAQEDQQPTRVLFIRHTNGKPVTLPSLSVYSPAERQLEKMSSELQHYAPFIDLFPTFILFVALHHRDLVAVARCLTKGGSISRLVSSKLVALDNHSDNYEALSQLIYNHDKLAGLSIIGTTDKRSAAWLDECHLTSLPDSSPVELSAPKVSIVVDKTKGLNFYLPVANIPLGQTDNHGPTWYSTRYLRHIRTHTSANAFADYLLNIMNTFPTMAPAVSQVIQRYYIPYLSDRRLPRFDPSSIQSFRRDLRYEEFNNDNEYTILAWLSFMANDPGVLAAVGGEGGELNPIPKMFEYHIKNVMDDGNVYNISDQKINERGSFAVPSMQSAKLLRQTLRSALSDDTDGLHHYYSILLRFLKPVTLSKAVEMIKDHAIDDCRSLARLTLGINDLVGAINPDYWSFIHEEEMSYQESISS